MIFKIRHSCHLSLVVTIQEVELVSVVTKVVTHTKRVSYCVYLPPNTQQKKSHVTAVTYATLFK